MASAYPSTPNREQIRGEQGAAVPVGLVFPAIFMTATLACAMAVFCAALVVITRRLFHRCVRRRHPGRAVTFPPDVEMTDQGSSRSSQDTTCSGKTVVVR